MARRTDYRSLSLWLDSLPDEIGPRPPLSGDETFDVAIVGGGFTGLWTAYYLAGLDPGLRVALLEADVVGFGASGRNGGWATGGLSGVEGLLSQPQRRADGLALQRAVFDAVDEVGRVCEKEGIDCHYQKGGAIHSATTLGQRESLEAHAARLAEWGFGPDDYRWLDADEARAHVRLSGTLGGLFTPHCAALHPAHLVRELGNVVERAGVRVMEQTRALQIEPGRVVTDRGTLSARFVLRATEAYTRSLAGNARTLLPLHSLMIATEPLSDDLWDEIGLRERETFGDARRIVIYGQRTRDGRIAFGARGDYLYGSGTQDWFDPNDARFARTHQILLAILPQLEGVRITHCWGGPLGVPRSWRPSVGLDPATGMGHAGGYVGQGVAASNLAGRTLAELVVDAGTPRTRLAWVGPEARMWEPEPLRWLAVQSIMQIGSAADGAERKRGRAPKLLARAFDSFVDH